VLALSFVDVTTSSITRDDVPESIKTEVRSQT